MQRTSPRKHETRTICSHGEFKPHFIQYYFCPKISLEITEITMYSREERQLSFLRSPNATSVGAHKYRQDTVLPKKFNLIVLQRDRYANKKSIKPIFLFQMMDQQRKKYQSPFSEHINLF